MNRPFTVGLTGGIGSGKTTATDIFAELNVPVIDADAISHEVVGAGQPALDEIAATFGADVIGDDGQLRRSYLRKLVFDDNSARHKLESIVHPHVRSEIAKRVGQVSFPYCIVSSPLLLESPGLHEIDRIVVIDAPESLQIERASQRDDSGEDEIIKIIKSQISRQDRVAAADDIIVNDRDLAFLRKQVEAIHEHYLALATGKTIECS